MYSGIVCKIKTHEHPNADKIKLGIVCGHQVVVSLETQEDQLGVFFPCDGQLSHEMCMNNNLYQTNPDTGEKMGGFFSSNRRVRAQKFRGEKSEGFWIPLQSLAWTGVDIASLKEGEEITTLNGKLVCEKYYTNATKGSTLSDPNKKKGKEKKPRACTKMFAQHFDTAQLKYNLNKIPEGSVIYITEKLHGTSGRTGRVLVEYPVTGWRGKVNSLFRKNIFKPKLEWKIVTGSRRVDYLPEQEQESETGFYAGSNFRFQISKSLEGSLKKGETLYYEIVGYTDTNSAIMGTHIIKDKEIQKKFGESMTYSYGCAPGTWEIYVYRITMTNEDGDAVELSWPNVVQRCAELNIKHVPELRTMIYDTTNYGNSLEIHVIEHMSDGHSVLDSTTLREGVCFRVEHPKMTQTFKNKGYTFKVLEGLIKDNEQYVDMEEIS